MTLVPRGRSSPASPAVARSASRRSRRALVAALALVGVAAVVPVGGPLGAGVTLTFAPSADATIRAGSPTSNFGSSTRINVDNSPVEHALLKFAVSGVGTSRVTSAKLRLYNVNSSNAGGAFSRVSDSSWGESTVTWNTAPVADPTPIASLGAVPANAWYEVDLTAVVTGDGTYSLRVASTSSDGADYRSKEGPAGFGPQLVVAVTSDASAPVTAVTSPTAGQTVSGAIAVEASASDDTGVTRVELSVDGTLRGTTTAAPYTFPWDTRTAGNGSHALQTSAYDAAGNVGRSPVVTVIVGNATDTSPPSIPTGLSATTPSATRVNLVWTASQDDVGVTGYTVLRDGVPFTTTSSTSSADPTFRPGESHAYAVQARDAAGNTSPPSDPVSVTIAASASAFSFAAAGDYGANARTDASLGALDRSGVAFSLALGDLDYDETATDAAWCDYVRARLPTLGPAFPFQLVAGNHEEQGGPNGYVLNHAACLPDRMGSTLGPTQRYGAEYFFDYPRAAPLVRVVMLAPGLTIENVRDDYTKGSPGYVWLAGTIDAARADGIPWVVVGMHYVCLSGGVKGCFGPDLMNLLVEKKVDLVLQGHDHDYQRGKQLAVNPSTCPTVPIGAYDPDCVVDDGVDGIYPKGAGSIFVVDGTFGEPLSALDPLDAEAPFFVRTNASTWGFMRYSVTVDGIDARFVSGAGTFGDTFSIRAGETPGADRTPPSPPANLTATAPEGTRVELSWTASTDDTAVARYEITRDGHRLATATAPTAAFSDTTATPGATYSYSVTAYDLAGNPSASASVSVTTPGGGTTLTFTPAADASLKADMPASNFGISTKIDVDNSPVEHTLLKFVVSGVGTGHVTSAKLRLYTVNGSNAGGVFSRVSDSSWGETTVTWNTAPAADPVPIASLGPVALSTWCEVDLSALVTGDGTYSLRVSSTSTDGADYTSKDGAAGFGPKLVVTLG